MMVEAQIQVGILGFGFMGQTHFRAYRAAQAAGYPCGVRAICDSAAERCGGLPLAVGNLNTGQEAERLFEPAEVQAYRKPAALLADANINLVSICTHTDSHVAFCLQALEAGKHVLVEKPVSTSSQGIARVAAAAAAHPRQIIMPAMCIRFWPGYTWLQERVFEARYGQVRSATFHRLGTRPRWAAEFYDDCERSGGALSDLHIHDVDFICNLFGMPSAVASVGDLDHLTTFYRFDSGKAPLHVVAEGGWDHTEGFGFQMRYVVIFEDATADFDSRRGADALRVYQAGEMRRVALAEETGYDFEIRHLLDLISKRSTRQIATLSDAVVVTRVLEAERASLRAGRVIEVSG